MKAKYPEDFSPSRWAGKDKNVEQLAEETNSADLYNYFYSVCSEFVHGSVRTDRYYMRFENGALVFYPGPTDFLQPDGLRMLCTVFPLFWDEASILTGKPAWPALKKVASNENFEHFSRNPNR